MKKHLISFALIAAFATVLCACVEEMDRLAGHEVQFKAVSEVSYLTKTSYSGTVNSSSLERIDWEPGDIIRIVSDVAATSGSSNSADYDLSAPEANGKFSYSTTSPHGADHGLLWGSGTNTFYATFPACSLAYDSGSSSSTATFTLPADQSGTLHNNNAYYGNMNLAYMTAATTGTEGDDITLSFTPAVTTFYVSITNTTGDAMSLEKVALICDNEPLTGSYTAEISAITGLDSDHNARNYRMDYLFENGGVYGGTLPVVSDANNTIYASFSPALSVPDNGSVVVALFALPRNAYNNRSGYGVSGVDGVENRGGFISHLTLSVTSAKGTVSLPLKDSSDEWIKFASEHKHNITNVRVPEVASYVLDVDPTLVEYDYTGVYDSQEFTVISHKSINNVQKAAPWKTQIQVGSNWVDLSSVISQSDYTWLANFPVSSESTAEATTTTTHTFHKAVSAREVISHEERLRNGVVYDTDGTTELVHNTAATAVDLSKYDFINHKMETARYTANTYIISAPGYYKIPLVFGNAIENNSTIPDSYNGRTGLGHLNYFICPLPNGDESSIHLVSTRPWLNSARSQGARIHWEKYSYWDANSGTDGAMVTYNRGWDVSAPVTIVDDLSIEVGSGNERYLVFHVDENNIRPGNWVLASMSNSDGTGNVCWSWQIWITDQSMNPVTISNGTSQYSILPVNLGWVDLSKGQFYPQREALLRFASTEKEGLYSAHTLTVRQKEKEVVSTTGWSTFYQWGRKDPMTDGATTVYQNDGMVHESIKHPSNIMYDKSSYWGDRYFDWTVNNYNNLWDSKNTDWDTPSGNLPNHKTVYDPSPRRYSVPPDETFDGFTSYESASPDGLFFATVGGGSVFFPAAGFMNYTSGQSSVGNDVMNGYWTYHPGENVQRRTSYCMRFTYNTSSSAATVTLKNCTDMDRAYAFSVRPVYYGVAIVPGLKETEVVFANAGWTNGQDINGLHYTYDGVTVTFGKYVDGLGLGHGNNPSYNSAGEVVLDYYSTITVEVAAGQEISEIVIEFGSDDHGDAVGSPDISVNSPSGSSYSNGVWSATNNNGTLVPATNSVQLRTANTGLTYDRYIVGIKVTYKE